MKRTLLIGIVIAAVAILVAGYFLLGSQSGTQTSLDGQAVSASVLSQLYVIANNGTLAGAIGTGSSAAGAIMEVNGTPLIVNGKPAIVYVSADYCPYCAVTRWSLILAMMRFGNFTQLHYMSSSPTDIYPDTATFSFYNSSYSSDFISFVAAETADRNGNPLQTLNAVENATFSAYNLNNTALPASHRGGIPFIDFSNASVQVGAAVSPQPMSGMDWAQIIAALQNTKSPIAQGIIGDANIFTSQICAMNPALANAPACAK